jgi:molybdate/tungstate transport system substrate-binding protein
MKKNTGLKIISVLFIIMALLLVLPACGGTQPAETPPVVTPPVPTPPAPTPPAEEPVQGDLAIYHAGSLAVPFDDLKTEFNKIHPDVNIMLDSGGSSAEIRKITELGKIGDILASADYELIPKMMYPDYAEWYLIFAFNRMVLCYTDQSDYAGEINADNWYDVLTRDGVVYGHSDPDQDPCGYRTLMVWQLAEKYYKIDGLYNKLNSDNVHQNVTRPKSVELIALLQSGDMDYAFEYLSVAKQHNLKYIEFPRDIDLSDKNFKDFYANATVEIAGTEPGQTQTVTGAPIVYGLTIPSNAANPDLAAKWVEFLISKDGNAIMERNFQVPQVPALASDLSLLPENVAELCTE